MTKIISEKNIFTQISLDDIKKEEWIGYTDQVSWHSFKNDELTDSIIKFEEFDDFQRMERQSVSEYIALFDLDIGRLRNSIWSYLLKYSHLIKLFRRSNISTVEKMLV